MLSRRAILQTAGTAGLTLAFTAVLPGLKAAAQAKLPVRRSVGAMNLDDKDLSQWRDFVGYLQSVPQTQRVSWLSFATIHGDENGFNLCPHGDWYFLPWHRCYVSMYEQAVRTWSGDNSFAMPYWDWTVDRQIPKAYSDQTYKGKANPLFHPNRIKSPPASLPDNIVGPASIAEILAISDYQAFGTSRNPAQNDLSQSWINSGGGIQGLLEGRPHNYVHGWVGGDMGTSTSARDPIFFRHHCNIDRIWALWNQRGHMNTKEPLWLDMPFTDNFLRMDGSSYTNLTSASQDTTAFGYTYDLPSQTMLLSTLGVQADVAANRFSALFGGGPLPTEATKVTQPNRRAASTTAPLSVPVNMGAGKISAALGDSPQKSILKLGAPLAAAPKNIVAILRDVPAPATTTAEYRVFVNCAYLSADVPVSDPHYVTSFAIFGGAHAHAGANEHGTKHASRLTSYFIDLTPALQLLARRGELTGDAINVQIVPVPQAGSRSRRAAPITPAAVDVAIL